jgi:4-amino-4-deoxy-L-arabinose transferase-like glycosyltransferase
MRQRVANLLRPFASEPDRERFLLTPVLFVLTLFARLPFRSHLLYDHDSVQFALALREYDIYLHQPHPPGYFLYVQTARLIDYFVGDANSSLTWISAIASALAVAVIYHLGAALFDRRSGLWAALIALTSPLFWFFGEVALTYTVAAFFSSSLALGTWRAIHGDGRWILPVSFLLGVAAGFRQDLALFLGPLWLLALWGRDFRVWLSATLLLVLTVACWFVPMVLATGGASRYFAALWELWQFNNDSGAIWNSAPATRIDTMLTLAGVLSYGIGLGAVFLVLPAYVLARRRDRSILRDPRTIFFVAWLAPALLFFIVVFIPPYKYSYGLVLLPAFIVLLPPAVRLACAQSADLATSAARALRRAPALLMAVVALSNGAIFCWSNSGFSLAGLHNHERLLTMIFSGIQQHFPSQRTVILGRQRSTFSGFRHVQYYLPEYLVYLVDQQRNARGEKWHAFGGHGGKTIIKSEIEIPAGTERIVYLADPYFPESNQDLYRMNLQKLPLSSDYAIFFQEIGPSSADAKRSAAAKKS